MRNELREQAAARPGFKEPRLLLQYPVDYLDVPHDLLCMRLVYHSHYHWFGFGVCFKAEATRGAGGYQEDDSMVARKYQWSDISIPPSKKGL